MLARPRAEKQTKQSFEESRADGSRILPIKSFGKSGGAEPQMRTIQRQLIAAKVVFLEVQKFACLIDASQAGFLRALKEKNTQLKSDGSTGHELANSPKPLRTFAVVAYDEGTHANRFRSAPANSRTVPHHSDAAFSSVLRSFSAEASQAG